MAAPDAPAAQEQQAVAPDWLATAIDASDDGIVTFGLDLRVRSWSAGAERIFGYTSQECVGQPLTLIGAGDEAAMRANLARLQAGESVQVETTRLRKDGTAVHVALAVAPVRDAAGAVAGGISIVRDVGQTREAQMALVRSQEMLNAALRELAQANDTKDRFIAMLSHELRNPLAAIASSVELLCTAAATEDQRRAGAIARRQSLAMKVLLDDLLDVTRLRQGQLKLQPGRVRLQDVVRSAEESVAPLLAARGHSYACTLPPHDVVLEADAVRVAQVIANLLSNAAKYTPDGGSVRLQARAADDWLEVDVQDDGAGLDTVDLERVFGFFVRGRGPLPADGLGVGLALARSIVQLHGGTLVARSDGPGRGSTFTVRLPLPQQPAMEAPGEVAPAGADDLLAGSEPATEGLVLLVEDNADAAWAVGMLLRTAGFDVLTAATGTEALRYAGHHRPAVVLLDLHLPDMHGHEVGRRIREQPWGRDVTLLAITGFGQQADLQRSQYAGFDGHLTKPVSMAQLRQHLQQCRRRAGSC